MKKIIILLIFVLSIFAKELVITKYINNKPPILIEFHGPKSVEKILKMDFEVLDHFQTEYNISFGNNPIMEFNITYNKNLKTLNVEYIKNHHIIQIKKYKSTTYAYFPFLVHRAVYDINNYFHMPDAKFLIRKVIYSLLVAPKETNIYLSDYTFSYKKLLISGGLNIFPKWADQHQRIIYFTKIERVPILYSYNIYTGKLQKILSTQGLVVVSDVNKNGNILLTLAPHGSPDIYMLKNKELMRITHYPGIDVDGKFLGKNKIAFISDRYGPPYVFVKDLKTGSITRILYHGNNQVGMDTYKNEIVISSRESDNAFKPNTFNLFLVNLKDESLKRLTFTGQNMFPEFSIDGSSIMFIKRKNFFNKIGIIRLKENRVFYFKLPKILQSFDW